MSAGMAGSLQGIQQDTCFKGFYICFSFLFEKYSSSCFSYVYKLNNFAVPGRSPPIKRCTSSIPPSGPGSAPPASLCNALTPMPDQRIHAHGQCSSCQTEINV
jgi:hypothetical protein